jgi:hypothetical protein
MGNHSDTGELLEEAQMLATTEGNVSFGDTFVDEYGNTIKLDKSAEELTNPTRLKDSSGRDVDLIKSEPLNDANKIIWKEDESKKKKAS